MPRKDLLILIVNAAVCTRDAVGLAHYCELAGHNSRASPRRRIEDEGYCSNGVKHGSPLPDAHLSTTKFIDHPHSSEGMCTVTYLLIPLVAFNSQSY